MLNHISGALKLRRVILVGTWYNCCFSANGKCLLRIAGLVPSFPLVISKPIAANVCVHGRVNDCWKLSGLGKAQEMSNFIGLQLELSAVSFDW